MTGVFVAGTDTGVGKTVVTAGLTARLRDAGREARAIKPAQTGCPPDDDARFVADACGDPEAATALRRLEPPLAPRVAGERVGEPLSYDALLADCRRAVERSEVALVEGIGGVRVPLADDAEVLDLAVDLGLPAVVVARAGLGTLNHTALTVDALTRRGVRVHAVVLNRYRGATVAERTNVSELERTIRRPVFAVPSSTGDGPAALAADVRDALPPAVLPNSVRP
ncbi:dethiobiotin synthase [Halegenticoccus tardaugens]|uniref:dethiobiotin synthase n=1 Tax=Halegenticoccus tardaugens TaxID=2071624 RepID=UPI001E586334|nr:dethiobiotin synthase [Halegenticoccus tardaugens]